MGLTVKNINFGGKFTGIFPQAPVASFIANPTRASTGTLTVSFTDTSTGTPTAWLWDFKNDGTATSTQQNPTYTYTTPGTYSVKLTVTNARGVASTATSTNLISFAPAPVASFSATPRSGQPPLTVNFTDSSTGSPTSWAWDFDNNGTVDSTLQNPSYTYNSTGTYSVKMTATSQWGTSTSTQVNYITVTNAIPADTAYTVLQLPGTGTNNTNNNVFLDSSSNNFTITRFGNTTQGSFSPFSTAPGYWSNYFDGSGDFLSVTDSSAFALSGTDFTIEAWVYLTAYSPSPYNVVICGTNQNDGANGYYFAIAGTSNSYNNLNFLSKSGTTTSTSFGGTAVLNLNTWYHVALSKSGTTYRIFVNGQVITTTTSSGTWTDVATLKIGAINVPNYWYYFPGYISNLRIVKGTAVYTSNFTPSTTPLTAVSGTSLLTCQSNNFIDNSSNAFAITRVGDTSVSAFGPFAPASSYNAATMGGSMYFDGTNDYLSTSTATVAASGNFTIEGWVNASVIGARRDFFSQSNPSADVAGRLFIYINASGSFEAFVGATPSNVLITHTSTVTTNQWYHFAFVRDSNVFKFYINGVVAATQPTSSISIVNFPTMIGTKPLNPTYWNGYISNIRVTSSAVYTANFTPPAAPVAAITGTSLLLNGTNGAIVDQSTKNNIETLGDAKISTAISANGSMYFDGTGDYLSAPASNLFNFGTGNFTIECWIYPAAIPVSPGSAIIDTRSASAVGWAFQLRSNFQLRFFQENTIFIDSNELLTQNVWNHVALVRSASTLRVYVNGISTNSSASTTSFTSPQFNIGAKSWSGSTLNAFNGYINDLRITNGIARYTANFTPPSRS